MNADNNTLSVFVPGEDGVKPAFQGMIFCLLAFIGFEAAAPLGEETREPRRTIPRAVIWSAILVGLFYVFCYYAATVFFGPDEMTGFYTSHDGDPWGFMAERGAPRHRWPAGRLRDPQQLARQRQRGRDGGDAIAVRDGTGGAAAALLCRGPSRDPRPGQRGPLPGRDRQSSSRSALGLVLANDPFETPEGAGSFGGLNVYVFLGTMLGLIFAGIYMLVNLACIGYFWRERRDEFNVIKHLLVPILGVIAMIPALLAVIGGLTIPILDIELPPYETALRYTRPDRGSLGVARHRHLLRPARPQSGGARSSGGRLRGRRRQLRYHVRSTGTDDLLTDAGRPPGRPVGYSKIPSGQWAVTTKFGTSTISLMRRSTATLHSR